MPHRNALAEIAAAVDAALDTYLDEPSWPERVRAAMHYAVSAGGKRLRPFLLIQSAGLFAVDRAQALPAACALECLHSYSLVHDDLPAMDDDDLRRGKPTVHVAFDDATAILAGDGLLTFAFEILARPETHPDPAVRADLVGALARAAGAGGMVGGQMLDLAFETQSPDPDEIRAMQALKTGALFHFACEAGARLGGADTAALCTMRRFAGAFGVLFQITDDLMDREASDTEAGKRTGKDAARGKATFEPDAAYERAHALADEACAALTPYGARAEALQGLTRALIGRRS